MTIFTDGARFWGGQIDRIDEALLSLGYQLTQKIEEADLVYSNNGPYDDIIERKDAGAIRGKIILNVLDLAPHLVDFPMEKTRQQLAQADAVTCISETVQRDLKIRGGFDSTVIYNPMKPIGKTFSTMKSTALFVGRVNDPEKRSLLGAEALRILGIASQNVITTGGEYPAYGGRYFGVATDQQLNDLYNGTEFLICPTRNAFLGLPILEACAAGAVPVFCRDLDIREEFFPSYLFPEYDRIEPTASSIAGFMWRLIAEPDTKEDLKKRLFSHHQNVLAEKLSPIGVAQRIIDVYKKIA